VSGIKGKDGYISQENWPKQNKGRLASCIKHRAPRTALQSILKYKRKISFLECARLFADRVDDRRLEKYVPEAVQDAERDDRLSGGDDSHSEHSAHLQHRQLHARGTNT